MQEFDKKELAVVERKSWKQVSKSMLKKYSIQHEILTETFVSLYIYIYIY